MDRVYIKSIELRDFMTWEKQKIDLIPGLNTIWSEYNNTGKSVIIRALKCVINPESINRTMIGQFIRENSEKKVANIIIKFSDGSVCVTQLTLRGIFIKFSETGRVEDMIIKNHEACQEVNDRLGAIVDTKNNFIVNVLDSDQKLFLVDSDPKVNYNLMEVLTHHKELNNCIEKTEIDLKETNEFHKDTKKKLDALYGKKEFLQYIDLDPIEERIATRKILLKLNDVLYKVDILTSGFSVKEEIKDIESLRQLNDILETVEPLNNISIIESIEDINSILKFNDILFSMENYINENIEERVDDLEPLLKLNSILELWDNCDSEVYFSSNVYDLLSNLSELMEISESLDLSENYNNLICLNNMLLLFEDFGEVDTLFIEDLQYNTVLIERLGEVENLLTQALNLIENNKVIQKEIDELNSIEWNGTIISCPIHGDIEYKEGMCLIE